VACLDGAGVTGRGTAEQALATCNVQLERPGITLRECFPIMVADGGLKLQSCCLLRAWCHIFKVDFFYFLVSAVRMDKTDLALGISIALALLRTYEFYSDRRRKIETNVRLTGSEDIGNTIVLLNKSKTPVTISCFDLIWVKRRKLFGIPIPFTRRIVNEDSPVDPPDGYDQTIPPHDVHHLVFREGDHFEWGIKLKETIYLRLWLHGRRRPLWLHVTGPGAP
jgi:hypothetical protein